MAALAFLFSKLKHNTKAKKCDAFWYSAGDRLLYIRVFTINKTLTYIYEVCINKQYRPKVLLFCGYYTRLYKYVEVFICWFIPFAPLPFSWHKLLNTMTASVRVYRTRIKPKMLPWLFAYVRLWNLMNIRILWSRWARSILGRHSFIRSIYTTLHVTYCSIVLLAVFRRYLLCKEF